MSSKDLTFRRKERKYIILEHDFEEINQELQAHIPVYHFEGRPALVNIETTYFDTEDFLIYNEYLARSKFRFKIRMRRYGYEGIFDPQYLVEMKINSNSLSHKNRFILPGGLFDSFVAGEDLRPEIKEANQSLIGAQKTYRLIYKLLKMNQLVPVLQTSYSRIAYQKGSKRVRVTVDTGITHKSLIGKPREATLDALVLESKIMGKTPKWHREMVNSLSLLKQQRFSKFATGINSLYFPKRGKYYFYHDDSSTGGEMSSRIVESCELLKTALRLGD